MTPNMTKLGVNIDHSATLRQARYRGTPADSKIIVEPDPAEIALAAESAGADSITAHLREDRRHICDADMFALRERIRTKLNMEMACSEGVISVALKVRPDYVCLVPENRAEVTTEGGLDVAGETGKVASAIARLSAAGAVCSAFIDPDERQVEAAKAAGAAVVELHTGAYANAWGDAAETRRQLERLARAAEFAKSLGLTVNSGHGINYSNIAALLQTAGFNELNIGHSIVCRALLVGIGRAVEEMKELIVKYGK